MAANRRFNYFNILGQQNWFPQVLHNLSHHYVFVIYILLETKMYSIIREFNNITFHWDGHSSYTLCLLGRIIRTQGD